jgi:hypothetical protein
MVQVAVARSASGPSDQRCGFTSGIIRGMQQTPPNEPAHDVLAAEMFAVPAPDPTIHHGPVRLPEDPSGIEEPHDVLAAEEFAMPAPLGGAVAVRRNGSRRRAALGAAVLLVAFVVLRRLRAT